MNRKLVIVAAPRSGVDALVSTLITDPNWVKSKEIFDAVKQADAKTAVASPQSDENSGSVEVNQIELNSQGELSQQIAEIHHKFPTASFIYLTRTPIEAIRSTMVGWRSKQFITHQELPGWWGDPWSFPLVPNWQDLIGLPIPEVAGNQWFTISEQIIFDLKQLPKSSWTVLGYEELLLDTEAAISRLTNGLNLSWNGSITKIPLTHATDGITSAKILNRSNVEVAEFLAKVPSRVASYQEFRTAHLETDLVERYRAAISAEIADEQKPAEVTRASAGTPFSYQHSMSFAELLQKAKSSLAVSTYKSGHLIFVRADEHENKLNCSFKGFNKPMGIAVAGNRLALGTMDSLATFTNQPALADRLKSDRLNDAVYFPRATVNTGDIAIHEMAYGFDGDQTKLWFINTKFSCLCTLDVDHSFEPVWRPEWITDLAPEDRCHLNGLAMANGKPKYVSALAKTNEATGWRDLKGTSGLIIDVETNEIIAEGLSMPHSPRWYRDQLWILESGKGTLAKVNPYSGDVTTVATLPGFTRGLAFLDKYAFIGLSQVRESVFSELPVTQTKDERNCGVWIVDITTGDIVGMLRFDGAVQEIFDVSLLPNMAWPRLETDTELTHSAYVLSNEALAQVKPAIAGKPQN